MYWIPVLEYPGKENRKLRQKQGVSGRHERLKAPRQPKGRKKEKLLRSEQNRVFHAQAGNISLVLLQEWCFYQGEIDVKRRSGNDA